MAPQRSRKGVVLAVAAGTAAVVTLKKSAFVPPAGRTSQLAVPAALAAAGASAPAWADPIGDAAKQLAEGAYPFMKEVDWNSYAYLTKPGNGGDAKAWAGAVAKAIDMGSKMDTKLLKDGVMAHHNAIASTSEANPVLSKAEFEAICAALGRMIASVPESTTMGVYNAFASLVDPKVPAYLMGTVKEADAKKAYEALMAFKDVVKANPITASTPDTPAGLAGNLGAIDGAASKLASAAYPFVKNVDWTSTLPLTPLPGVSANQALKAIDKALVMGASMDGKLLKEAAQAHVKALNGMDGKLVATESDFAAVTSALGKVIASVPQPVVMDVYNGFGKIVNPTVYQNLFKLMGGKDAEAAYSGLLQFKDVVKTAQR